MTKTTAVVTAVVRLLAHDTTFRGFKETHDILNLRTIGHLLLDLHNHILNARLTVEQQTVSISNVLLDLLIDLCNIHDGLALWLNIPFMPALPAIGEIRIVSKYERN